MDSQSVINVTKFPIHCQRGFFTQNMSSLSAFSFSHELRFCNCFLVSFLRFLRLQIWLYGNMNQHIHLIFISRGLNDLLSRIVPSKRDMFDNIPDFVKSMFVIFDILCSCYVTFVREKNVINKSFLLRL